MQHNATKAAVVHIVVTTIQLQENMMTNGKEMSAPYLPEN